MSVIDIVGSTLLGAAVLLAIFGMNFVLSDSSQQFGADLNAQENMVEFTKAIQWDLAKIGYRDTTRAPILVARPDTLVFLGDIDNDGTVDVVKYYKGSPAMLSSTPNPNDFILYRIIVNKTENLAMNLGLTKFQLSYVDSTGTLTLDPKLVRGVKIVAMVQSPYSAADSAYSGAYWENTIYPRNLNVNK